MKRIFCILFFLFSIATARSQSFITGYEYWIDTAYSARTGQSVIPQGYLNLQRVVQVDEITRGVHTLNMRFMQSTGFWSSTISSYFFNTGKNSSSALAAINAFRYWVDGTDSLVTDTFPTSLVSPVNFSTMIDLSFVRKGMNVLHTQFRDEQFNWSVPTIDTFFKMPNLVGSFSAEDSAICTKDSVRFINNSIDGDVYLWRFGDGDSSTQFEPVHHYAAPGDYTVSLTVTDTTANVDTTITKTDFIHIMPSATAGFTWFMNHFQVTLTNTSTNAIYYTWHFGDGDISHLDSTLHTYPGNDTFTVVLMAYDSCGWVSDTQDVIVHVTTGISEAGNDSRIRVMQIDNEVSILFNESGNESGEYSLLNAKGEILLSKALPKISQGYIERFTIESLSQGIYFLRVVNGKGVMTRRVYRLK